MLLPFVGLVLLRLFVCRLSRVGSGCCLSRVVPLVGCHEGHRILSGSPRFSMIFFASP